MPDINPYIPMMGQPVQISPGQSPYQLASGASDIALKQQQVQAAQLQNQVAQRQIAGQQAISDAIKEEMAGGAPQASAGAPAQASAGVPQGSVAAPAQAPGGAQPPPLATNPATDRPTLMTQPGGSPPALPPQQGAASPDAASSPDYNPPPGAEDYSMPGIQTHSPTPGSYPIMGSFSAGEGSLWFDPNSKSRFPYFWNRKPKEDVQSAITYPDAQSTITYPDSGAADPSNPAPVAPVTPLSQLNGITAPPGASPATAPPSPYQLAPPPSAVPAAPAAAAPPAAGAVPGTSTPSPPPAAAPAPPAAAATPAPSASASPGAGIVPNFDNVIKKLYAKGFAPEAMALQKQVADAGSDWIKYQQAQLTYAQSQSEHVAQVLGGATNQAEWTTAKGILRAQGIPPAALAQVPDVYDPAAQERIKQQALTVQQQLEAHSRKLTDAKTELDTKATEDELPAKVREGEANATLAEAKANLTKISPEQWASQIDAIVPAAGANAGYNAMQKSRIGFAARSGDVEGAKKILDESAEYVAAPAKAAAVSNAELPAKTKAAGAEAAARMPTELAIAATNRQANLGNQSYAQAHADIAKEAGPLEQTAQKIANIKERIANGMPQDWANVPAMVLSLSAGGQGSGLRMNQALIEQELGGAGKWAQLQGFAQQFNPNTDNASKIGDIQKAQFKSVVASIDKQVQARLDVVNGARTQLNAASPSDTSAHRAIADGVHTKLQQLDQQPGGGVTAVTGKAQRDALPIGARYTKPGDSTVYTKQ